MDFNEAVPSLLIIVIVLLYYLYRIKKKKLHEEEQKYIETFLIRDRDISHLRVGSPFKKGPGSPGKINKLRNQDSQLKGPDSPLIGKNISKSLGKMSPVRKTSASLQGKTSPKIGGKLQFSDEIGNYQSPKTKLEYTSPKRVQNDAQSKIYNFESIRLQKIQEENSNSKTKTPEKLDSRGNLNAKFRAMHDTKTSFEDLNVAKSPNPAETRQPQPQEDLKVKEIAVRKDSAATKGKREICFVESDSESDHEQVKIVHDSSFEEEPQNQEEVRPEANKRQPPGKSTIYLEYLEDLGSGMGLKKYIAKKTVQEYVPYTDNSSKTISQLLSSQKVARVAQKIATTTTTATTATTSQAAKPQGGMFASTTSTTATTTSTQGQTATTAAPANKGGIFGGSTTQPQATATTATTANKPQGGGLFGNSTATTTTTQSGQAGAPAAGAGATGGGIFGNKTAPTSAPTTANNSTAAKPSGGLFNTQPQNQGQTAAKPQATAGTAPLQVKTTGLFGNAAQGADKNAATPLFPKGGQTQTTQPTGKGRERSGGIEDFEGNSLKKMNIK